MRIKLILAVLLISLPSLSGLPSAAEETLKITYLSRIQEPSWAWGSEAGVYVHQNQLYIPLGYPGLAVYDISRPYQPVRLKVLSSFELGGQAGPLAVRENRAYLALPDESAIAVIDVSNPARPAVLTRFTVAQGVQQLQIRGSYLYVQVGSSIQNEGGIFAFDLSKEPPSPAGQYTKDLIDPGFFLTGTGMVFLARTPAYSYDSAKIDCVDMSRPEKPVLKSQWASKYPGNISDIDMNGTRLFCAAYWGGIWVLDASDVTDLRLAARFDWIQPAPYSKSIRAVTPYVFLAQGGPAMSDQKFSEYKMSGDGLRLIQEIPASTYTHSVFRAGELLFLIEQESPWGNSFPQKIIRVYRIESALLPPTQVSLKRQINRSLFFQEAVHTISWRSNPGNEGIAVSSYRVYRKPAGGNDDEYVLRGAVSGSTLSYVDFRLKMSQKFEYVVTAVDGEGLESPFSITVKN